MAGELTLRVITPERIAMDTTATSVRIPGVDGSMGILARHAGMVAALDTGQLRFSSADGEHQMFVNGGFAEVRDNTVRVVTEAGEHAAEIDVDRAREAEQRARERIHIGSAGPETHFDSLRAEAALRRAQLRLLVSGGSPHQSSS